jgi:hypothetical protein
MKKIALILVLVALVLGGGYTFISWSAQKTAEESIGKMENDIEDAIPGVDFIYEKITANFMNKSAIVSKITIEFEEEIIAKVDNMEISGDEINLKLVNLSDISVTLENRTMTVDKLSVTNADAAGLQAMFENFKENPMEIVNNIDMISIGEIELVNIKINEEGVSNASPILSANIKIDGINQGVIEKISLSINDMRTTIDNVPYPFVASVKKFELAGLNFGLLIKAAMEGEEVFLAGAQQAFGINDMRIEGLKFDSSELNTKIVLSSISMKAVDDIIQDFTLEGLSVLSDEGDIKIDKAGFKGLDLSSDLISEDALIQNASRLYGLSEIKIENVSFLSDLYDEVSLGEMSLSDVEFEDGLIVKGTVSIRNVKIPLSIIEDMEPSMAQTIGNMTNEETFLISTGSSINFDTKARTYNYDLDFSASGFGGIKFEVGLADMDFQVIKDAAKSQNIIEALAVWPEIFEDIAISSIKINYNDQELADTLLQEMSDEDEIIEMAEMPLEMFLEQYQSEKALLLEAIKSFLKGKNSFMLSMTTNTPIKLKDVEMLFMEGDLTKAAKFDFQGN